MPLAFAAARGSAATVHLLLAAAHKWPQHVSRTTRCPCTMQPIRGMPALCAPRPACRLPTGRPVDGVLATATTAATPPLCCLALLCSAPAAVADQCCGRPTPCSCGARWLRLDTLELSTVQRRVWRPPAAWSARVRLPSLCHNWRRQQPTRTGGREAVLPLFADCVAVHAPLREKSGRCCLGRAPAWAKRCRQCCSGGASGTPCALLAAR